jgi:hypothetical protein
LRNLKGKDHVGNLGVDGRAMKWISIQLGYDNLNWIYLAQERNQRRDLVNTVMKLGVP